MRTMQLRTADGRWIAGDVRMACSFAARCCGLIGNRSLHTEAGLLLSPASSIHTLGMRFAIDVVFLSRQMRILGLAPGVPPWRVRLAPRGTGRVLELAAGRIAAIGLTIGSFVVVESEPRPTRTRLPGALKHRSEIHRGACERLPISFSLRLPLQHRCVTRDLVRRRCQVQLSIAASGNEPS